MKTYMSRAAISVALAAVAIVCRWKGCSRQSSDALVVGPTVPTFERPHDPPRPPSPQPANAARVMAVQLCGERGVASSRSLLKRLADDLRENAVVRRSAARALRTVSSQAQ